MPRKSSAKSTGQAKPRTPEQIAADALFQVVIDELGVHPNVGTAKMFGGISLTIGGKGFAMSYKGRLVLKLPQDRVQALVAGGEGAPFDPGSGRVMKEWVAVSASNERQWIELAREAQCFVESLL